MLEQENNVLYGNQNMAYVSLAVIAIIFVLGAYAVKKNKVSPVWLLIFVPLASVSVGFSVNHYNQEITENTKQIASSKERMIKLNKPAEDIFKACSSEQRKPDQDVVWGLSGNKGSDKSSVSANHPYIPR